MERIKNLFIIAVVFGAVLLAGCTTSSGSLFKDTTSSDAAASSDEDSGDDYSYEDPPGLTIHTTPKNADVYIGDFFAGTSPVTQTPGSGNYRITVKKDGYTTITEWVSYSEGESVSLYIDLEPITGFLNISVYPNNAELSTGGENLYEGINELRIGQHLVTAELFGFETIYQNITIHENRTTDIRIEMVPAEFRISPLFAGRTIFNPANPSGLGMIRISFDVSSWGTGELAIFSSSGEQILLNIFPPFVYWDQSFVWKGKDGYGKSLADGEYKIVVTARDSEGLNSVKKETFVTLDSTLIIRTRSTQSGVSGALFCPDPSVLPEDSLQVAVSAFGHIESDSYRFPVLAGVRIAAAERLEMAGTGGIVIQPDSSEAFFLSVSVKNTLIDRSRHSFAALSWYLKGAYQHNLYTDTQTNFTGLSAGLPFSVSLSPISFVLTPEIIVSPYKPSYTGLASDPGFYIWGYARAAVILDLGAVTIGASAALRSTSVFDAFSLSKPVSAGVEIHWLIPGTGIFVTGIVSGDFRGTDDFYINAGGGIGLIN